MGGTGELRSFSAVQKQSFQDRFIFPEDGAKDQEPKGVCRDEPLAPVTPLYARAVVLFYGRPPVFLEEETHTIECNGYSGVAASAAALLVCLRNAIRPAPFVQRLPVPNQNDG